ncbi:MAG: 1-deoxy-D-xylulose-5-phosphate reductoisomerase [Gammaproteobacteria bacterium]|nr:1-deoxy-D-xylulose-5-phosphate reductoisomerase [Gammaproteobacteria bacterium]
MNRVTILGSTGTIGINTLDVIARNRDRYRVFALTANTNWQMLAKQCREFSPDYAVLRDEASAVKLRSALAGLPTEVQGGEQHLYSIAGHDEVDTVMAAIVGAAGLQPTLAAVKAGKRTLLANKESLVMSGALFMNEVERNNAVLLPIDSEHNAIYQCLANGSQYHSKGIRRLILTGSGGPLLRTNAACLKTVTPDQACAHPNWRMGRKISVDSATMMNKGLELLEAGFLFRLQSHLIDVVIHPQSIVHSMVEYLDGSVMAQLGNPDMRTPIAHGLAWPDRIQSGVKSLDMARLVDLHFEDVDLDRFPCLQLAREVSGKSQSLSIALNAANEVAVAAFLDERICFTDIPVIINDVLEQTTDHETSTIEAVIEQDGEARKLAFRKVKKIQ